MISIDGELALLTEDLEQVNDEDREALSARVSECRAGKSLLAKNVEAARKSAAAAIKRHAQKSIPAAGAAMRAKLE